ncbi:MAG: Hpt domain-containing protein [Phycisphaerae bacterium]
MSFSDPITVPDKLASELLADDSEVYDLVQEFVEGLADRVAKLRQAYEQLNWDVLTTLAHQLKGASGSYGYPDLSGLAAIMEDAFRVHSADRFAIWVRQLEQLAAAARAGLQDG